mgnify:CR=1 FL=1
MLRRATNFVTERTAHPILAGLMGTAAVFAAIAVAIEQLLGPGIGSGFLMVYAIVAAFMSGLGYALLLASGIVSRVRRGGEQDPISVEP